MNLSVAAAAASRMKLKNFSHMLARENLFEIHQNFDDNDGKATAKA